MTKFYIMYVKTKFTEIWLEEGIIFTTYEPGTIITLKIAEESVAERLKISEGRVYPLFADLTNVISVEEDARKFLSQGDAIKFISAGAFLIRSKFMKLLASSFILIHRPPVPTRFFNNYEQALKWLQFYRNIN